LLAGLLAGHRLRPLDPHRPLRCLHHHKPGARSQAGGDPEAAVDMDSNACRAREVERNVWRDDDSLLRSPLLKTPQLVIGRFPLCQSSESAGPWRRVATGIGATELRSGRRRSSHCVLSRLAQGSSGWCNRRRIAQVPEQLALNQRSKVRVLLYPPSKSPKRPPLLRLALRSLLAERASPYRVIVSSPFTEQLRVRAHVPPPFSVFSEQHPRTAIERFWMGSLFGADSQPPGSGSGVLPLRDACTG
jgi:hypothetical protein